MSKLPDLIESCREEWRKNGATDPIDLTADDCEWVVSQLGRKPTREEWADAGLPDVGGAHVGTAATSTYGGIVHAECRVDFYDGGDYWSLSGPLCRSQTMPGSFVVADKRHGGDYVFPMAGRDVEVYLPGEEDPIIQYKGLRCVRGAK